MTEEHGLSREQVEALLANALHDAETRGGWWAHDECAEFARIAYPAVAAMMSLAWDQGHRAGTLSQTRGRLTLNPYTDPPRAALARHTATAAQEGTTTDHPDA